MIEGIPNGRPARHENRFERRALLWLPFAFVGGRMLRAAPIHGGDGGGPIASGAAAQAATAGALTPLTRDELGEKWRALVKELAPLPKEADESYAAQLAGLIARTPIDALPKLDPLKARRAKGVMGGPSWFVMPCVTVEFRMDPGAVLRPHNHPPQVVVTLCAEGEASYRHFEIEGDAPPCTRIDGSTFEIRETRAGILKPGRTTALTRARDGIHGFVAGPEGARLVDFTVGLTADMETFSYVEVSDEPSDPARRIFEASWLGKER